MKFKLWINQHRNLYGFIRFLLEEIIIYSLVIFAFWILKESWKFVLAFSALIIPCQISANDGYHCDYLCDHSGKEIENEENYL